MTNVDLAAEREKQALKDAFSYRDFGHDLDRLLDDTERAMFASGNRAGHSVQSIGSLGWILATSEK